MNCILLQRSVAYSSYHFCLFFVTHSSYRYIFSVFFIFFFWFCSFFRLILNFLFIISIYFCLLSISFSFLLCKKIYTCMLHNVSACWWCYAWQRARMASMSYESIEKSRITLLLLPPQLQRKVNDRERKKEENETNLSCPYIALKLILIASLQHTIWHVSFNRCNNIPANMKSLACKCAGNGWGNVYSGTAHVHRKRTVHVTISRSRAIDRTWFQKYKHILNR